MVAVRGCLFVWKFIGVEEGVRGRKGAPMRGEIDERDERGCVRRKREKGVYMCTYIYYINLIYKFA